MTRVALLGRHRLALEGLAAILGRVDDVMVAGTGLELDDFGDVSALDVLVVDSAGLPPHAIEHIVQDSVHRLPSAKTLVLVEDGDDPAFLIGLDAGAAGCVPKSEGGDGLCEAVQGVTLEGFSLGPELTKRLVERMRTGDLSASRLGLTSREMEILREIAAGATNQDAGERLGISESTVKNHLYSIYRKLDVGSRSQAVAEGYRRGIIEHP